VMSDEDEVDRKLTLEEQLLRRQLYRSSMQVCLDACRSMANLPLEKLQILAPDLNNVSKRRGFTIKDAAKPALAKCPGGELPLEARRDYESYRRRLEAKWPPEQKKHRTIAYTCIGNGQALNRGLGDDRNVRRVVWLTVPCGTSSDCVPFAKHSVLQISVVGISGDTFVYMMEKTGDISDPEHGIRVSDWKALPKVEEWSQLKAKHIVRGMRLRTLYQEALQMGPYDVLKNNCHHAAQRVFNKCVKNKSVLKHEIPNQTLVALGRAAKYVLDLVGVRSSTVCSGGSSLCVPSSAINS